MIKIYDPYLNEKTKRYAHDAIESGWISSQGEYIQKATDKLGEILKTKNLFLVSNGTTGMHCVSKAINYKYQHINTLIVPNNSYVAAWNTFLYDNKFKLISVDCDIETWNYNLQELFQLLEGCNIKTTALLCVHNLGNIINIQIIKNKFPDLTIVEDNCEGLFGKYNDKFSGTESFASAVSFFGNKTITCGEGGAVIVNDEETLKYLKSFINQGNTNQRFIHDKIAQNYRITNIQAALLYGQLESLDEILNLKFELFETYKKELSKLDFVEFQKIEDNTTPANWMFGIRFTNGITYEKAFKYLQEKGIDSRPMFYSFEKHKYLNAHINSFKTNNNANFINQTAIILPSYPSLKKEEIRYIIKCLKDINN
jgi:perosamine synthetase